MPGVSIDEVREVSIPLIELLDLYYYGPVFMMQEASLQLYLATHPSVIAEGAECIGLNVRLTSGGIIGLLFKEGETLYLVESFWDSGVSWEDCVSSVVEKASELKDVASKYGWDVDVIVPVAVSPTVRPEDVEPLMERYGAKVFTDPEGRQVVELTDEDWE